jgi:hypothetical protein
VGQARDAADAATNFDLTGESIPEYRFPVIKAFSFKKTGKIRNGGQSEKPSTNW